MLKSSFSIDVILPVYNEERDLERGVAKLREFLQNNCPYQWRIVVADNASKDRTLEIAQTLAQRWPSEVGVVHLDRKGRGRALRRAWLDSSADVVSYMDVDLSTGLDAFMPMIEPLAKGEFHIATGSRLLPASRVTRSLQREFISRAYNLLVKLVFPRRRFSDAQCGFKACTRRAAQELVPLVEDQAWFFDSELLIRAEQRGYRIHEVPARWEEDPGTTVKIASTAWEDIKGLFRVRFHPNPQPIHTES